MAGRAKTLSDQDPDMAARAAAYQKRKEKRKANAAKITSATFLSNVQETEDDVSYRFNFVVVGAKSEDVIQRIVGSQANKRLSGNATAAPPPKGGHRCLCEVKVPPVGQNAEKLPLVQKVAKLALNALTMDQDMPIWETRQEAMSSAIVYVLWIDGQTQDGESTFEDQLQGLHESIALLRSTSKARLRPVKGVLLLHSSHGRAPKGGLESWALSLSNFEHENGDLWKFGPVCFEEQEQLHATFAEMTAARLRHTISNKDEAPGQPDERSRSKESKGEQELYAFKPSAGQVAAAGKGGMQASRSEAGSSSRSEQELPPAFEAEASGSECSEGALEVHRMAFGLNDCAENTKLGGAPKDEIIDPMSMAKVEPADLLAPAFALTVEQELRGDAKVVQRHSPGIFCCSILC